MQIKSYFFEINGLQLKKKSRRRIDPEAKNNKKK